MDSSSNNAYGTGSAQFRASVAAASTRNGVSALVGASVAWRAWAARAGLRFQGAAGRRRPGRCAVRRGTGVPWNWL